MPHSNQDLNNDLTEVCFQPDWSKVMTADEAEYKLDNFKWKGCGWYENDGSMLLVTPVLGGVVKGAKRRFHFHVYEDRNPVDAFNWVINAPTRT